MTSLRQSRLKLAVTTALFAAWALVLGFMAFVSAYMAGIWSYVGLSALTPLAIAFAVAATMSAMNLARPGTLTAGDDGISFVTWRGERRIAWGEIEEFIVLSPESRLRSPGVVLKTGTRRFVSFGRNWEQSPEEIVAHLTDALSLRQTSPSLGTVSPHAN